MEIKLVFEELQGKTLISRAEMDGTPCLVGRSEVVLHAAPGLGPKVIEVSVDLAPRKEE